MREVHPVAVTYLVTGGAGFVGSHFVRRALARNGVRVVTLDRLNARHTFVEGDVCDRALLADVFASHRPQAVVHFAAESHVDRSIDGPRDFVTTNVVGTFELLEAARRHLEQLPAVEAVAFRFLHVSTDEVYGSLGAVGAFSETSTYAPNSPYAATKAASDHLVRAYHQTYGVPTLTTHSSNNFGPFQLPEKLLPRAVLAALEGESIPVYGDGSNVRDWLYVTDHCEGLEAVLSRGRPGETYALGAGNEHTNLTLVNAVCEVLERVRPVRTTAWAAQRDCGSGYRDLVTFVEDRPGHDRRYAIDASKAWTELGWTARTDYPAALEATVRWYVEHPEWCAALSSSVRRDRLGLGGRGT
jgi:dTDP-glucose 4,6-dehydratase